MRLHLPQSKSSLNSNARFRAKAAEALGAIGNPASLAVLELYKKHDIPEIAETCDVAVELIKFNQEAKCEEQLCLELSFVC